jgi:hypothetical protein
MFITELTGKQLLLKKRDRFAGSLTVAANHVGIAPLTWTTNNKRIGWKLPATRTFTLNSNSIH